MAKTNLPAAALLLASLLLSGNSWALALGKDVQDAIGAYNAKDYSGAVALLEKANKSDPLVRYYLALSYQGLGNFQQAETQYRWGYLHKGNKDLQYKSWQGLEGILTMKKNRKSTVAGYVPKQAREATVAKEPMDVDTSMKLFKKEKKVDINIEYRAGCPRHY